MDNEITLTLTRDEAKTLVGALVYVNAYFGDPPDPPTPGMTVAKKLDKALEGSPA